uniref:Uncharacterized protein n=1 Tax=Bombyx mori TaxID=7091 RepID=A0A8R2M0I4_BOMMO|nr:uncharacterized protein LOC101736720 isoform X2 [Bombyx mori]XP_037871654.1 uncharacterized protein LOC101736720 isoform X2 [Bombyx mori]
MFSKQKDIILQLRHSLTRDNNNIAALRKKANKKTKIVLQDKKICLLLLNWSENILDQEQHYVVLCRLILRKAVESTT